MLKVAPCEVGSTIVSPMFSALIGYWVTTVTYKNASSANIIASILVSYFCIAFGFATWLNKILMVKA